MRDTTAFSKQGLLVIAPYMIDAFNHSRMVNYLLRANYSCSPDSDFLFLSASLT